MRDSERHSSLLDREEDVRETGPCMNVRTDVKNLDEACWESFTHCLEVPLVLVRSKRAVLMYVCERWQCAKTGGDALPDTGIPGARIDSGYEVRLEIH